MSIWARMMQRLRTVRQRPSHPVERLQISKSEDGNVAASVQKLSADAMNEFAIVQAQKCDSKK